MAEKRTQTENDKAAKAIFASLEDAKAAKADNPNYKPIRMVATRDIIVKAGTEFFTSESGPQYGFINLAKDWGLKAEAAEKASVVRVVEVEKDVTKMTVEELKAFVKKANAELKLHHASSTGNKNAATASESLPLSEAS